MNSTPIIFNPHPALYDTAPGPNPPSPSSPYEQLKQLDELLDREESYLAQTRQVYQQALQEFATRCHQLWQQEKSQGSRRGNGFRSHLQDAGIKVGRAYRAMKKFFPADFPVKSKAKTPKALTLSAANEVGLCFTGKVHEGKEVLQCVFALTTEEKAELVQYLQVVDARQVQHLLLEAVKRAAATLPVTDEPQSKIANKDAACNTVPSADALLAPGSADAVPADRPGSPTAGIPLAAEGRKRESPQSEITNKACPRLPRLAVGGEPATPRDAACNTLFPRCSIPDRESLDAQPGTNEQLLPLNHQLARSPNDRIPEEGQQMELPK